MWLSLLSASALASAPDCRIDEEDYFTLRDTMRDMRRDVGARLVVAGDGARCERALRAIVGNDPLLGVQVVEVPDGSDPIGAVEIQLHRTGRSCGAVLAPADQGWTLIDVGNCVQSADPYQHTVTVGYWNVGGTVRSIDNRGGLSGRITTHLGRGLSALADGSIELEVDPDEVDAGVAVPVTWRLLGGFDATRDGVAGGYLGFRGGLQHVHVAGELERDAVFQSVLGHRWIGRGAVFQVAGGVMALVPTEDYTAGRTLRILPLAEIRLGIAP